MREAINFLLLLFVFLIGISSFPQNVKKNSVGEEKVTKMIKSLGRMFNWTIYKLMERMIGAWQELVDKLKPLPLVGKQGDHFFPERVV